MQIEDVARICLASWRTAKEERKLAVRNGLLRQIVVDDQHMLRSLAFLALPHEVLAHGASRIRGDVLQRSRSGTTSVDDDGVIHRAVLAEHFNNARYRGILLADGNVDADHGFRGAPVLLLVDDAVEAHSGLASLAVADDQLALTTTHGNHAVNRLDSELERLLDGLTRGDAGGNDVNLAGLGGADRRTAIDGNAERIDHASKQFWTHWHFQDASGGLDGIAFTNQVRVTKEHGADGLGLQVHGETGD